MQLQGMVVWSGVYYIDYSSGTKLIIGSCTGLITNNPCFWSTFDWQIKTVLSIYGTGTVGEPGALRDSTEQGEFL